MLSILLLFACSSPSATRSSMEDAVPPAPAAPSIDEAKVGEMLAKMVAEDTSAKMAALAAFPTIDLDDVRGKKYRSPENAPKYINSRTSVHAEVVTDLNDTVSAVFVQFSYVGDDWIFFDKATIAAGDFRATPTFERPVRDNGGGKVWEHTRLLIDPDPNPALWAALPGRLIPAVTAEKMTGPKVIVRFEGSEYYKDYELKAWEKDSIKAALVLARKAPGRDDAIAALDAPEAVTSGP